MGQPAYKITEPNGDIQVAMSNVEVGEVYPIYGLITKVLSEVPGDVEVEINNNIKLKMPVPDEAGVEMLKERVLEWGIFVSKVTSVEHSEVSADCKTVIFGRKPGFHA